MVVCLLAEVILDFVEWFSRILTFEVNCTDEGIARKFAT